MGIKDILRNVLGIDEEEEEYEEVEEEEYEEYEEEPKEYVNYTYSADYSDLGEDTIFVYQAQQFDDVRYIKPVMKKNVPVIVNLSAVDDKDERRRFLDFAWGMARAGGGRLKVLDTRDLYFALILPSEKWNLVDEVAPSFSEPEDVEEGEE